MLRKFFLNPVYVQIAVNRIILRDIATGHAVTLLADPAFSHERMLIGNFTVADAPLKKGLKQVRQSIFSVAPTVLLHPLDKLEGGCTQVEQRVFQELALGAGARKMTLWTGKPLSGQEVLDKLGKP
jgi:hypothetical protein